MPILVSIHADVAQRLGSMAQRAGLSFDEMSNRILREACGGGDTVEPRPAADVRASFAAREVNVRVHGIYE